MKEHAVLSKETPGQIYASHVASTTDEVKIALGKKDTIKHAIRYTQRGQAPSEPLTVKEFKIEDEWAKTCDGSNFLIHDSGPDAN